jgi:uncharacterized protein (TIGR03067 family)
MTAYKYPCILTLILSTSLASASPQDATATDLDRLQGTWQMKKAEQMGRPILDEAVKDQALVFEKGTYKVLNKDQVVEEGAFTIDAAKNPRTIDLKIEKGSDKGKSQVGIYALEGQTLRCVFERPGLTKRPEKFETSEGSTVFLVTLERKPPTP